MLGIFVAVLVFSPVSTSYFFIFFLPFSLRLCLFFFFPSVSVPRLLCSSFSPQLSLFLLFYFRCFSPPLFFIRLLRRSFLPPFSIFSYSFFYLFTRSMPQSCFFSVISSSSPLFRPHFHFYHIFFLFPGSFLLAPFLSFLFSFFCTFLPPSPFTLVPPSSSSFPSFSSYFFPPRSLPLFLHSPLLIFSVSSFLPQHLLLSSTRFSSISFSHFFPLLLLPPLHPPFTREPPPFTPAPAHPTPAPASPAPGFIGPHLRMLADLSNISEGRRGGEAGRVGIDCVQLPPRIPCELTSSTPYC